MEDYLAGVAARWRLATVSVRYRALQQFFGWLLDEEEIERNPMARMKPPTVPENPVPVLTLDELRRLVASCEGRSLADRRDNAIIRLFADTGMRLGAGWPRGPPTSTAQPQLSPTRTSTARPQDPVGWEPAIPARILLRIATGRPARRARDVQCPLLVSVCDQDLLAPGVPAGLRSVSYGVFEGSRIAAGATGCRSTRAMPARRLRRAPRVC